MMFLHLSDGTSTGSSRNFPLLCRAFRLQKQFITSSISRLINNKNKLEQINEIALSLLLKLGLLNGLLELRENVLIGYVEDRRL